ncbi:hypothetical protein COCC4DRAFT_23749 [Bipolaris maydis ATCC 48331]|uniref:Uncharacterized protein n=1 Tax=Cochliobolus heterostrophus (strain C4 / ATCC 48331 / race T) TaxID=665024 RepID=N4XFG1_COCH4|nr:uncharacterized protein COCC4DRAFT_23749 [Bipolaris maydis ATCC 48331]ENI05296.1 hypothetical protein COCC4DRAFT_23749 [Bipolaris maydis ATCC 48331]
MGEQQAASVTKPKAIERPAANGQRHRGWPSEVLGGAAGRPRTHSHASQEHRVGTCLCNSTEPRTACRALGRVRLTIAIAHAVRGEEADAEAVAVPVGLMTPIHAHLHPSPLSPPTLSPPPWCSGLGIDVQSKEEKRQDTQAPAACRNHGLRLMSVAPAPAPADAAANMAPPYPNFGRILNNEALEHSRNATRSSGGGCSLLGLLALSPQASPGAAAQSARYCRRAEKRAEGRIARGEAGDTWLAVVAGADGGPWRRSLAWGVLEVHSLVPMRAQPLQRSCVRSHERRTLRMETGVLLRARPLRGCQASLTALDTPPTHHRFLPCPAPSHLPPSPPPLHHPSLSPSSSSSSSPSSSSTTPSHLLTSRLRRRCSLQHSDPSQADVRIKSRLSRHPQAAQQLDPTLALSPGLAHPQTISVLPLLARLVCLAQTRQIPAAVSDIKRLAACLFLSLTRTPSVQSSPLVLACAA